MSSLGFAGEWFVSPSGTTGGDGSRAHPLDLVTAISEISPARPGDTVWLLGGVYTGSYTSLLTGTNDQPIILRQFPGRKRATIDGPLSVQSSWTTYWGFEVRNSYPDRTASRPTGVDVLGPNNKLINLIVHDAGSGIGCWSPALEAEIYGCTIYHNGWQGPAPDRGHGHGIYGQNETGTKRFTDNIIFNQYGFGIHIYGLEGAINGFDVEGNISFENGSPSRDGYRGDNILIGGYQPAERIAVISNYTYTALNHLEGSNVELGYVDTTNLDLVCQDNYFAGGFAVVAVRTWQTLTLKDNTIVGSPALARLTLAPGSDTAGYTWDRNSYFPSGSATPFINQGQESAFADWQQATGFDSTSEQLAGLGGQQVFVRPNRYEPGRLHIVVYNWDRKDTVFVDIKSFLPAGTRYKVFNALNIVGKPVAAGRNKQRPLRLRLNRSATGPEFNAFVLVPVR